MTRTDSAAPLGAGLNARLSLMMFLQYAIWGAWLPFLWSFLSDHRGMDGGQIGYMFAAGAVGAIFGPFIAGQIADRYFSTERFLGVSHILGGVLNDVEPSRGGQEYRGGGYYQYYRGTRSSHAATTGHGSHNTAVMIGEVLLALRLPRRLP